MNLHAVKALAVIVLAVICLSLAGAPPDELTLQGIKVDASNRAISFPAAINMRTGAVEYLLVHEKGKVHESIFRTTIGAQQIQAAALLFSSKGTNQNGQPVLKVANIEAGWTNQEGKETWLTAPALILDKRRARPLGQTKWEYHGSRIVNGIFLAERDGSLIAIMEDSDALIDQDTPDASMDHNWEPIPDVLPQNTTNITIRITFAKPQALLLRP